MKYTTDLGRTMRMAYAAREERKTTSVELAARRLEMAAARLQRALERLAAQKAS